MDFKLYNDLARITHHAAKTARDWLFPPSCLVCSNKLNVRKPLSRSKHELTKLTSSICDTCQQKLPYLENACRRCALEIPPNTDLCGNCLTNPPPFDETVCVFNYAQPIDQWIHKLKYDEQLMYADVLARFIAQHAMELQLPPPEIIIAVPSHPKRLAERGFNHSELIAKRISKLLNMQYEPNLIKKCRHTPPQASLSRAQRLKNHTGTYKMTGKTRVSSVAIIDDVVTTGATTTEISKILKRNGVNYIQVWSFARR